MTRFVILAAPRTGSNWLCTLLDSHPDILCHHEIFNPDGIHVALSQRPSGLGFGTLAERERAPSSVLDRVWRTTLGHRAVGFKINRDQSESVLRQVLGDRDVRKIIVRRSNRIRTYVSERIAEATGEWESYPGLDIGRRPVRVRVEAEDLRQHVGRNRRFYETAGAILEASGQGALDVRYEDLGDGRTHRSILEYLQVAPDVVLQGATRKQNPAALDRLIENFEALRSALRGTELERDLMDQDMSACQAEDVR